ncbi:hypothetical protein ACHAW5_004003 [Stephanodiscus triporus]|uniref:UBX domain-containing protein n=1 Tax=Stephanodiscus triporus TaxID=2934178 RepID=A0ABD3PGP5_9STRA
MNDYTTTQRRTAGSSDAGATATSAPSSSTTSYGSSGGPSSSSSGGIHGNNDSSNNNNGGGGGGGHSSSSSSSSTASGAFVAMMLPLRVLTSLPSIAAIVLRVFLWPALRLANVAFPPGEYDGINNRAGSDRAARAFVDMFREQISIVRPTTTTIASDGGNDDDDIDRRRRREGGAEEHYVEPPCPFAPRGYDAIVADVAGRRVDSRPLLLLYLHSPLHPDGRRFVGEYLCHPRLLRLLNASSSRGEGDDDDGGGGGGGRGGGGSVVCFGTSVHSTDGQRMRDVMGVSRFPFLALLDVKSSSSGNNNGGVNNGVAMETLLRMEGPRLFAIPPEQITVYLNTAITRHADILAAEATRRMLREEESRLRAEQDAEYREALEADRTREDERRAIAERERRAREEEEEAARLRAAMEEDRIGRARSTIEMSGGEPSPGSADAARLRFALPNGKRIDRRFRGPIDTVGTMRAFLVVHFHECGIEMRNIGLSTNFPRRTYTESDDALTLEEAGLSPQAVVMVQDLDS